MPSPDGQLRIGLLEDDADFCDELALGLGGYGFHVACTCGDAQSLYRTCKPPLVTSLF